MMLRESHFNIKNIYENLGDDLVSVAERNGMNRPLEIKEEVEHLLAEYPKPSQSANVLEVGCGYGRLTKELIKKCGSYTGIDINPHYVRYCRTKYGSEAEFHEGDISDVGDNQFNIIVFPWLIMSHYSVSEQLKILKTAKNKLKSGHGCIVLDHLDATNIQRQGMIFYENEWGTTLFPANDDSNVALACHIPSEQAYSRFASSLDVDLKSKWQKLRGKAVKYVYYIRSG